MSLFPQGQHLQLKKKNKETVAICSLPAWCNPRPSQRAVGPLGPARPAQPPGSPRRPPERLHLHGAPHASLLPLHVPPPSPTLSLRDSDSPQGNPPGGLLFSTLPSPALPLDPSALCPATTNVMCKKEKRKRAPSHSCWINLRFAGSVGITPRDRGVRGT